jgi:glycosyltransferase involved in cell wall biosynthesis
VPDLDLVAVGPPTPYLDEVRARVTELGLTDRVTIRGYIEQDELDKLYATAAVALVPSRYEGFGYAVAEALCAGLPVISARSSSLVEVAGADAPLVDPDDGDGWIEALRAFMLLPGTSAREAAITRERNVARFSWPRAAEQCATIYDGVINQ